MTLNLPTPGAPETTSLAECIRRRRSTREYAESPIPLSCLSELLWSAQGITGDEGKRASPSAGGRYPLHLHVLVRSVDGLPPGLYAYGVDDHSLQRMDDLPSDAVVEEMGIGDQPWLRDAAVMIGVAADLAGTIEHFEDQPPAGERGPRYVYMETGALAQNVQLYATALELGCVLVAGFEDGLTRSALRFSSNLAPCALLCIGYRPST
ncbi:SagB/ThcOx family dehydrogenase [Halomonas sp. I1]|uniref:SagB/ThcOx family dehydrogenase n=1 Tax=Halomonas sp. I1 TaxID=393536 RepID=UPI0028DF5F62|nr:SagB/ThcOx family dehydrogenase [Halomonas sp. I1]MDT8895254.1 SagB/ThcOx family dehydrogenase [Halomonas sp. I1]